MVMYSPHSRHLHHIRHHRSMVVELKPAQDAVKNRKKGGSESGARMTFWRLLLHHMSSRWCYCSNSR